ncbi:hypothetical protein O9929_28070 [Vibrio lentus]|nr:hypothetical protein [Vibrio lentus]
MANSVARLSSLYFALDISTVALKQVNSDNKRLSFTSNLGDRLSLHWFLKQINGQAVDNNPARRWHVQHSEKIRIGSNVS